MEKFTCIVFKVLVDPLLYVLHTKCFLNNAPITKPMTLLNQKERASTQT